MISSTTPMPRLQPISFFSICSSGSTAASYFNRVFRRRLGATPSDVREAAQRALRDRAFNRA
jgi:hypothetical protein